LTTEQPANKIFRKKMKFFTIEWWSGEVVDELKLFNDYREHVEGIFEDWPPDHQRLDREVSLHDAHLLNLNLDIRTANLTLDLDGCGYDENLKTYVRRRFNLSYTGVELLNSTADPEKGLPGPHGFGDLGYDEIHMPEPGLFEHRMLFSTGIMLTVLHRGFSLIYRDYHYPTAEQDDAPLPSSDYTFDESPSPLEVGRDYIVCLEVMKRGRIAHPVSHDAAHEVSKGKLNDPASDGSDALVSLEDFEARLRAQLKKKAEQVSAGQPATHPESNSEGNQTSRL
jgi:hypothetical protein